MVEGKVFIVDRKESTATGHLEESTTGRESNRLNMTSRMYQAMGVEVGPRERGLRERENTKREHGQNSRAVKE